MPKYVIHIGPPKAGSKYLQSTLGGLRKPLLRQKIFYPSTLMQEVPRNSHAALDPLLRASAPNAAMERAFVEMNAAGHEVIVLSWEGACSLPGQALAYLRKLIGPGNEVQVVYYCRRFADRIPSLWKQLVKSGRATTFPEAVVQATRAPLRGHDHNASLLWTRWEKVFGRDSLQLVSLNNLREHKVDLFDHFAKTFLHWSGTERPKRVTVHGSPNAEDSEIGRALNALQIAIGGEGTATGNIFTTYMRLKPGLDLGPIPEAMQRHMATLPLDDRATAFLPVYDALMAFKDRLVSPEYGTELFTRGVTEVSYVREDYLLEPSVVPALQAIHRAVRAAPPVQRPAEAAHARALAKAAAHVAEAHPATPRGTPAPVSGATPSGAKPAGARPLQAKPPGGRPAGDGEARRAGKGPPPGPGAGPKPAAPA